MKYCIKETDIRTSYSQNNTYISCPKYWHWTYVEKYEAGSKGASMYFGSAVDDAVTELLKGSNTYMNLFDKRWHTAEAFGSQTVVYDNPEVVYSYYDFDADILDAADILQLQAWSLELGLEKSGITPVELYKSIVKLKKSNWASPNDAQLKYFNRASWLSMKKKGYLLVDAFKKQIMPKIKKVIATQEYAKLDDPTTGDSIAGFIDMVLEYEGYSKPIIFDLKTAARPYKDEQIDLTDQLTLYAAMKAHEYNTDLVGYIVLPKNITKKITAKCKTCGFIRKGRFKTCNNYTNKVRCGGEWDEVIIPDVQVQVLVRQKSAEQIESLLLDVGNLILAMKNKIVYKNTSKCNNWYGNTCPFYKACHSNDVTGLKKKTYGGRSGSKGQTSKKTV